MYKYCKLEALDKSILHSYDGRYFTTQGSLKLTWYLFLAKKVMIFFFVCVWGGKTVCQLSLWISTANLYNFERSFITASSTNPSHLQNIVKHEFLHKTWIFTYLFTYQCKKILTELFAEAPCKNKDYNELKDQSLHLTRTQTAYLATSLS